MKTLKRKPIKKKKKQKEEFLKDKEEILFLNMMYMGEK